jgi:hypothetical protein
VTLSISGGIGGRFIGCRNILLKLQAVKKPTTINSIGVLYDIVDYYVGLIIDETTQCRPLRPAKLIYWGKGRESLHLVYPLNK